MGTSVRRGGGVAIPSVEDYPDLTFTVLSATDKTMSVKAANTDLTEANIPARVTKDGVTYTVTSIGEGGFENCYSLTSVTIPNSVTSMYKYAFAGCGLTPITIPGSIIFGGYQVFIDCENLTSTTIKNGVTSIGEGAFVNCTSLTSITIPNSVTTIDDEAFCYCQSLTSINIPNSVTSLDDGAFDQCSSLNYNVYDNAKYLGNDNNPYLVLIRATSTDISSCEINNKCRFMQNDGFSLCSNLTSITIPNGVTSIGHSAFYGCTSLTSITIPDSVINIGCYAFYNIYVFTSITFENTTGWYATNSSSYTGGSSIDVTSPTTNATNLNSASGSWYGKYLYRVDE